MASSKIRIAPIGPEYLESWHAHALRVADGVGVKEVAREHRVRFRSVRRAAHPVGAIVQTRRPARGRHPVPVVAHCREGVGNTFTQVKSLNRKSPYALSFQGMNAAIYRALRKGTDADARFSGASAVQVMTALDQALDLIPEDMLQAAAPKVKTRDPKPTAMVIGGTGFIGRALTRALVAKGQDVRVLSRGRFGPFPDLPDEVETVGVSLYEKAALVEAMQVIDVVYNGPAPRLCAPAIPPHRGT